MQQVTYELLRQVAIDLDDTGMIPLSDFAAQLGCSLANIRRCLDKDGHRIPYDDSGINFFYAVTESRAADSGEFKAAYATVGKGRSFVRIHRIREHLGWERSRFDRTLARLRKKRIIQIQGGNPSEMTDQEIKDSFTDVNGMVFYTVSLKKEFTR